MSTQPHLPHSAWPKAVGLGVAGSLIVLLVVLAFLWPSKATSAQNLPVSIAGPAAAVTALQDALGAGSPELFDFVEASDREDAVTQIEARETYGAIVLGNGTQAPEVLTAPASSAAATQLLTGVAAQLQTQLTQQTAAAGGNAAAARIAVTSIVPLSDSDPSGTGLAAASFPLTMGGMIGGVVISLLVTGAARRLGALVGFGLAAGLGLTLVLQTWFAYLQGDFWINAAAMGLSVIATASFIVGCKSLLGSKGIGVGAVVTMFMGNPISSAATPWQFLAEPWGQIGQFFVPGASNWLIRSLSYFPDANLAPQWWVLISWTAAGVALTLAAHFRDRAATRAPAQAAREGEQELVSA